MLGFASGVWAQLGPGDPAPDFELPDVHGTLHALSDSRGKVVLLDLIGYGCPPCIQSAPAVEQIWKDFKDTGAFQVLALDMWNGSAVSVLGFIDQTGVTFPVLRNAGYLQDSSQYGIRFDNYVVVDPGGIIRYTSVDEPSGSFNDAALRTAIEAYLPVAVLADTWSAIKRLYR
jgi:peroxiredoxin